MLFVYCVHCQARHRKTLLSHSFNVIVLISIHAPADNGQPSLEYKDTSLAIPGQMNGVVSERVAHFVVIKVSGLGLTLKWDMQVCKLAVLASECPISTICEPLIILWAKLQQ